MRPPKLKTTLCVLRTALQKEEVEEVSQKDRKTGALVKIHRTRLKPLVTKEDVKAWLGCSLSRVEHIESGSPALRLSPEDGQIIAAQTGVDFRWLMANDVSKPIINSRGKPYTVAEFESRQSELKKTSFKAPETNRDLWRVTNAMAEMFGMVAAVALRSLERGEFDVFDYKLRHALLKLYGGERDPQMVDLILKAIHGGKPAIMRPDVSPMLDDWATAFKKIVASKAGGKLPIYYPVVKPLPAVYPSKRGQAKNPRR
jgi:hypothetical protein